MKGDFLFVYGTLLSEAVGRGHALIAGRVVRVDRAWMQGRLYRVSDYPGMVDARRAGERVVGEVYAGVTEALLAELDEYEQCEEGLFVRVRREAVLSGGGAIRAWVYLYGREVREVDWIASGDFAALF